MGVENNLDVKVQKNYDSSINLLINTEPASIIQLKNKLIGFWHADRQIKDYKTYKSEEIKRATDWLLGRIFFACAGFFYKYYYNPSILNIGKKLDSRSKKTFAKIGRFHLEGKDYDVVAFHILADEKYMGPFPSISKFRSVSSTNISFLEKGQIPFFMDRSKHNFSISIIRKKLDAGYPSLFFEEDNLNQIAMFGQRHFSIERLVYLDYTEHVHGSDRLLDQKLTQIMIEILMQNHGSKSLKVTSHYDTSIVLAAAGFRGRESQKRLEELREFRFYNDENKLFPSYKDYGTDNLTFKPEDFTKQIVSFSRNASETWEEIIEREPILTKKSGIFPEYWEIKT